MKKFWTKEEETFLTNNYIKGVNYCCENLNRTRRSITSKAARMGLIGPTGVLSTEEYSNSIRVKNLVILEPYINSRTKIKHKHLECGLEWLAIPNAIRTRSNSCPKCAIRGYDPESPLTVYYICINEYYYKIGITGNSINKRFASESINIRVIWEHRFTYGVDAISLESSVKKEFKDAFLDIDSGPLKYGGNTEIAVGDFLGLD